MTLLSDFLNTTRTKRGVQRQNRITEGAQIIKHHFLIFKTQRIDYRKKTDSSYSKNNR